MNPRLLTQPFTSFVLMLIILIPFTSRAYENPNEQAENPVFTYGGELDFNSRYVWRGIALSDGAVMQPIAWISAYDLTFETWANFVINDEPNQGQFNEVNLISYYELEWNRMSIEPSIIVYLYPNQEEAPWTTEGSLKVSYPIGFINVFTTHIFDIVEYVGSYFGEAGVSYEHEFKPALSLEAFFSLAWASSEFNDVNIGFSKAALNMVGGGVSLSYYLKESLYIRPHIELSAVIDKDLRGALDDPTIVTGGLAIGMEF